MEVAIGAIVFVGGIVVLDFWLFDKLLI